MTDRLGYRLKIGIVIPSTNTTVQPETDAMRPPGVTNHIGRIHIPDLPLGNDTEFEAMVEAIGPDLDPCIDRVMTCKPGHLVMGMSIPTFWGGKAGSEKLLARLEQRAGTQVTMGSSACVAGLKRFPRGETDRHPDAVSTGWRRPPRSLLRGPWLRGRDGAQPQAPQRSPDRACRPRPT